MTPTADNTNVPSEIYLELGFSQPMSPASVEASTLRVTDGSGGDNGDQGLDIQIGEATSDGLINLEWNDNSTILTMTTNHVAFTLQPDNEYQLRMVVNKAKAAVVVTSLYSVVGLPLIYAGPGAFDLLIGYNFKIACFTTLYCP